MLESADRRYVRPPATRKAVSSVLTLPPGHTPEAVAISPAGDQIVYQAVRDSKRTRTARMIRELHKLGYRGEGGPLPVATRA